MLLTRLGGVMYNILDIIGGFSAFCGTIDYMKNMNPQLRIRICHDGENNPEKLRIMDDNSITINGDEGYDYEAV